MIVKNRYSRFDNNMFGIDLIPEVDEDLEITKRFYDGGIFLLGYSSSGTLTLSFTDLIDKPLKPKMQVKPTVPPIPIVSVTTSKLNQSDIDLIEEIIDEIENISLLKDIRCSDEVSKAVENHFIGRLIRRYSQ